MGVSQSEVRKLIRDTQADLKAFSTAFDAIQNRLREREEEGTVEDFADWPGTRAALNVLIMCRTRCEGLIEDLREAVEKLPNGLVLVERKEDD